MKSQLIELKKALKGFVVMSDELEKISIALFENQVPSDWSNAFSSLKPLATWIVDLKERINFL